MQSTGTEKAVLDKNELAIDPKVYGKVSKWLDCNKCEQLGFKCNAGCVKRSWLEVVEVNRVLVLMNLENL